MPDTHITSQAHRSCAHELGCAAARCAAEWITDGNDTNESRAAKLELLDGGYGMPVGCPNLSGEWAGDPTPLSLAQDIMGVELELLEDEPASHDNALDELAQAWEDGVSETFYMACETELRKWMD